MNIDIASLVSFAVITTFTPGPNNISCAAMGVNFGYYKTFSYIKGISLGFFFVMCLIGSLSGPLTKIVPGIERILTIIGSLYIVWLAWHTFKASYGIDMNPDKSKSVEPLNFFNGFILQIINPKSIIYAITIYSTFLGTMKITILNLTLSGAILAILNFTATSTWTIFGTFISRFMRRKRIRIFVNLVLAILLLWSLFQNS